MSDFDDYKYVIKVTYQDGTIGYYNGGNYCIVTNPYLASRYKTTEDKKDNVGYVKSNIVGEVDFALYEQEYKAYLEYEKKQRLLYDEY